jgi:hypothetical protein
MKIKELKIISDGSPENTHIFINGEEINCYRIEFSCAVDDILATLRIEPTFDLPEYKTKD